ncbi:putative Protein SCAI [Blattamonas nauphoetae]|uniref:Mediator of RNA polymerase II transcription subunit 13 n=1 Tax=Blattamonas nauphoetae TaxID=2049346 RepID=A0ABQ9WWN1_9EUKA|nr:putative Protein SCAI [Blattamonas nauphoetae]
MCRSGYNSLQKTMSAPNFRAEFNQLRTEFNKKFVTVSKLPFFATEWDTKFKEAFHAFDNVWLFQFNHRRDIEASGQEKIRKIERADLAARMGQLLYQYYLRTSDTRFLLESYGVYTRIAQREYFGDVPLYSSSSLELEKKFRYLFRYFVDAFLLREVDTCLSCLNSVYDLMTTAELELSGSIKQWKIAESDAQHFLRIFYEACGGPSESFGHISFFGDTSHKLANVQPSQGGRYHALLLHSLTSNSSLWSAHKPIAVFFPNNLPQNLARIVLQESRPVSGSLNDYFLPNSENHRALSHQERSQIKLHKNTIAQQRKGYHLTFSNGVCFIVMYSNDQQGMIENRLFCYSTANSIISSDPEGEFLIHTLPFFVPGINLSYKRHYVAPAVPVCCQSHPQGRSVTLQDAVIVDGGQVCAGRPPVTLSRLSLNAIRMRRALEMNIFETGDCDLHTPSQSSSSLTPLVSTNSGFSRISNVEHAPLPKVQDLGSMFYSGKSYPFNVDEQDGDGTLFDHSMSLSPSPHVHQIDVVPNSTEKAPQTQPQSFQSSEPKYTSFSQTYTDTNGKLSGQMGAYQSGQQMQLLPSDGHSAVTDDNPDLGCYSTQTNSAHRSTTITSGNGQVLLASPHISILSHPPFDSLLSTLSSSSLQRPSKNALLVYISADSNVDYLGCLSDMAQTATSTAAQMSAPLFSTPQATLPKVSSPVVKPSNPLGAGSPKTALPTRLPPLAPQPDLTSGKEDEVPVQFLLFDVCVPMEQKERLFSPFGTTTQPAESFVSPQQLPQPHKLDSSDQDTPKPSLGSSSTSEDDQSKRLFYQPQDEAACPITIGGQSDVSEMMRNARAASISSRDEPFQQAGPLLARPSAVIRTDPSDEFDTSDDDGWEDDNLRLSKISPSPCISNSPKPMKPIIQQMWQTPATIHELDEEETPLRSNSSKSDDSLSTSPILPEMGQIVQPTMYRIEENDSRYDAMSYGSARNEKDDRDGGRMDHPFHHTNPHHPMGFTQTGSLIQYGNLLSNRLENDDDLYENEFDFPEREDAPVTLIRPGVDYLDFDDNETDLVERTNAPFQPAMPTGPYDSKLSPAFPPMRVQGYSAGSQTSSNFGLPLSPQMTADPSNDISSSVFTTSFFSQQPQTISEDHGMISGSVSNNFSYLSSSTDQFTTGSLVPVFIQNAHVSKSDSPPTTLSKFPLSGLTPIATTPLSQTQLSQDSSKGRSRRSGTFSGKTNQPTPTVPSSRSPPPQSQQRARVLQSPIQKLQRGFPGTSPAMLMTGITLPVLKPLTWDLNILTPLDLVPFTRKPLFVIVDSDSSQSFKSLASHTTGFPSPLAILMSPIDQIYVSCSDLLKYALLTSKTPVSPNALPITDSSHRVPLLPPSTAIGRLYTIGLTDPIQAIFLLGYPLRAHLQIESLQRKQRTELNTDHELAASENVSQYPLHPSHIPVSLFRSSHSPCECACAGIIPSVIQAQSKLSSPRSSHGLYQRPTFTDDPISLIQQQCFCPLHDLLSQGNSVVHQNVLRVRELLDRTSCVIQSLFLHSHTHQPATLSSFMTHPLLAPPPDASPLPSSLPRLSEDPFLANFIVNHTIFTTALRMHKATRGAPDSCFPSTSPALPDWWMKMPIWRELVVSIARTLNCEKLFD